MLQHERKVLLELYASSPQYLNETPATPTWYFLISDINECETGLDSCNLNATCNNSIGSFICKCKEGFFGTGSECEGMYVTLLLSNLIYIVHIASVKSPFSVRRLNHTSHA